MRTYNRVEKRVRVAVGLLDGIRPAVVRELHSSTGRSVPLVDDTICETVPVDKAK